MDVIKKFDAAEEREDVNGMCELCTEDILFENPEWVTKNKADFKMKMKKEFANDTTKFSDVKPWVEDEVGKKYSRTMKVKAMMGLGFHKASANLQSEQRGSDQINNHEEDLEHPRVSFLLLFSLFFAIPVLFFSTGGIPFFLILFFFNNYLLLLLLL